jgi:hypothetical protein
MSFEEHSDGPGTLVAIMRANGFLRATCTRDPACTHKPKGPKVLQLVCMCASRTGRTR